MGKLYLIRHGETQWNAEFTYVGRTDIPLNPTGVEQAAQVAEELADKDIATVYTSTLSRAKLTGQIIAERLRVPVHESHALREVDYGAWEGVNEKKIPELDPELWKNWRARPLEVPIPGGESFAEMRDRAWPEFQRIAREHKDENIAVVAHKSVNRVLLCCLLQVDPNLYRRLGQDNACINRIDFRDDGTFVVESVNEGRHLESAERSTA